MNSLNKSLKKWNTSQFRIEYETIRKDYKHHVRNSYFISKLKMQHEINENPHLFYNFVRDFWKQSDDIPSNVNYKDENASSSDKIANLFRDFFKSVYSKPNSDSVEHFFENGKHNEKIRNICSIIPPIELDDEKIQRKIHELSDNMVTGPDNLPNIDLKP